jgi:hypothetical protein
VKLEAFFALYAEDLERRAADALHACWTLWNTEISQNNASNTAWIGEFQASFHAAWADVQRHAPTLHAHARAWRDRLQLQDDLASQLVTFCQKTIKI